MMKSNFKLNQRVEGKFDQDWYMGTITQLNTDGTYIIEFDDGDRIEDIREYELRIPNDNDQEEVIPAKGVDIIRFRISKIVAKGLKNVEISSLGKNDPFLDMSINNIWKAETSVIDGAGKNATWRYAENNTDMIVEILSNDIVDKPIILTIIAMDKNTISTNNHIGEGSASLQDIIIKLHQNKEFTNEQEVIVELFDKNHENAGIVTISFISQSTTVSINDQNNNHRGNNEILETEEEDGLKYVKHDSKQSVKVLLEHVSTEEEDDNDDFKYNTGDKHSTSNTFIKEDKTFSALVSSSQMSEGSDLTDEEIPVNIELIASIASLLVPSLDNPYFTHQKQDDMDSLSRFKRLEFILYHITVAEHIRSMQCLYMDSHDELNLCSELRKIGSNYDRILSTQELMKIITQGRARILALIKMNYGVDSHLCIRAVLELANSYALQGLWEQVGNYVMVATNMLADPKYKKLSNEKRTTISRYRLEARFVCIVHSCVRDFCKLNNGQITDYFIEEVTNLIQAEVDRFIQNNAYHEDVGAIATYPRQFKEELEGFLIKSKYGSWTGQNVYSSSPLTSIGVTESSPLTSIGVTELAPIPTTTADADAAAADNNVSRLSPLWGSFIDFLRHESSTMKGWMSSVHVCITPQNLAILKMMLLSTDTTKKAILYPSQLLTTFMEIPAAVRLLVGTNIEEWFKSLNTDVRILINQKENCISDVTLGKTEYEPDHCRHAFLLPIAFEEIIARYACDISENEIEMLRCKLYTLQGMIQVFSQNVIQAEEIFIKALHIMEELGIEMEVVACELYNSIAQLMVTKHRTWNEQYKRKVKQDAISWVNTAEGQLAVENEKNNLLTIRASLLSGRTSTSKGSKASTEDIVARAVRNVYQQRVKSLLANLLDPTGTSIEAASRYLVRSYEIIERVHGASHPSYGASCLAVASVKNIVGDYESTREWLTRALRSMEKQAPLPVRAIAFVQVQLSQVLAKQRYDEEAIQVLAHSALFHMESARKGLKKLQIESGVHSLTHIGGVYRNHAVYIDTMKALEMTSTVMGMSAKHKQLAINLAENMADLAENAFGWDSTEAAQCRREVGVRYKEAEIWDLAESNLSCAREAFEVVYGSQDSKTIGIRRLLKECESHLAVVAANDSSFNTQVDNDVEKEAFKKMSKLGFIKSMKANRKRRPMRSSSSQPALTILSSP